MIALVYGGVEIQGKAGLIGAPRHKIGALAAMLFGLAVRG